MVFESSFEIKAKMLIDKQILFESAYSETNYNYILYNDFYLA